MSDLEQFGAHIPQSFSEKMDEFFRVASGTVIKDGLEGLATVADEYASFHPKIPEDVKTAMSLFAGALKQRTLIEHPAQNS